MVIEYSYPYWEIYQFSKRSRDLPPQVAHNTIYQDFFPLVLRVLHYPNTSQQEESLPMPNVKREFWKLSSLLYHLNYQWEFDNFLSWKIGNDFPSLWIQSQKSVCSYLWVHLMLQLFSPLYQFRFVRATHTGFHFSWHNTSCWIQFHLLLQGGVPMIFYCVFSPVRETHTNWIH